MPSDMSADVVVVGAGPGGSSTAYHLARAGLDVILLEKSPFPRDKICGDGLTPAAVHELIAMGVDTTGWMRNRGLTVIGGGHTVHMDWPDQKSLPGYGMTRARMDLDHALAQRAVEAGARLVFTTGGTGLTPRDVTPEATEPLLATRIDGLADAIRRRGEEKVASAALSRGLVGVTARSPEGALVVNAPGSRGGVTDTVAVIGPLTAHIIDQLASGDHPRA